MVEVSKIQGKFFIRNQFQHRFFEFVFIKIKKLHKLIKDFSQIFNLSANSFF